MNWLSWLIVVLTGFVSTLSALAISAIIVLVAGQLSTLLWHRTLGGKAAPRA
jgi:hypothetical protein